MSITSCVRCTDSVDTDFDDDCYFVTPESLGSNNHVLECLCFSCRSRMESAELTRRWPDLLRYSSETITAAAIMGLPIYGSWIFYAFTGRALNF